MKSSIFSGTNSIHILVLPHMILQAKLITCQKFINRFQMKYRTTLLTHSSPMHTFPTPENIRKPYGFLMFSGGWERVHCEYWNEQVNPITLLTYYYYFFSNINLVFNFHRISFFLELVRTIWDRLQISLLTLREFWRHHQKTYDFPISGVINVNNSVKLT